MHFTWSSSSALYIFVLIGLAPFEPHPMAFFPGERSTRDPNSSPLSLREAVKSVFKSS